MAVCFSNMDSSRVLFPPVEIRQTKNCFFTPSKSGDEYQDDFLSEVLDIIELNQFTPDKLTNVFCLLIHNFSTNYVTKKYYDTYLTFVFHNYVKEAICVLSETREIDLIYDSPVSVIEKHYILTDKKEIENYLLVNNFLIDYLIKAAQMIRKLFGSETRVCLRVVTDPDDSQRLLATIFSKYDVETTMKKMQDLDEEWYLDSLDQAKGRFNYIVEFEGV